MGRPLRKFFGLCLPIFISAAGCSRSGVAAAALSIESVIAPSPARVGLETVTLNIRDAHGNPAVHSRVALEADMSHPGMSPAFADAEEIAPGSYQGRLQLGMAGDWILLVHIALPDGQKVERQVNLTGVRPN
jgi:hypothetical protein